MTHPSRGKKSAIRKCKCCIIPFFTLRNERQLESKSKKKKYICTHTFKRKLCNKFSTINGDFYNLLLICNKTNNIFTNYSNNCCRSSECIGNGVILRKCMRAGGTKCTYDLYIHTYGHPASAPLLLQLLRLSVCSTPIVVAHFGSYYNWLLSPRPTLCRCMYVKGVFLDVRCKRFFRLLVAVTWFIVSLVCHFITKSLAPEQPNANRTSSVRTAHRMLRTIFDPHNHPAESETHMLRDSTPKMQL